VFKKVEMKDENRRSRTFFVGMDFEPPPVLTLIK
jgi:hypothetical protein